MTVDISPEQHDAEAAGPPVSLPIAIRLHRYLYRADVSILRLHVRDGESGLGPPFAPIFEAYLDGRYGVLYPWSAGWRTMRDECIRSHPDHGLLCSRLIGLVVVGQVSYGRACYELQIEQQRTERTLLRALGRIEERMAELQARATELVRSTAGRHDWQAPRHVHRPLGGLHLEDCPQCRHGAAAV